jgi:pimeloyl-ACP methyl ester carboxylesterase
MIELSDMGSFFVGGRALVTSGRPIVTIALSTDARYEHDPNGTHWVECAYVQYFLPSRPRFATPVLLVHGGGCTGAVWENTPDGRTGWLTRLLEANVAVYVIDNVERGRAGFCPFEGEWEGDPIIRSEEEAWSMYRFGRIDAAGNRVAFPGQQFPVEAISKLSAQTVPRWAANGRLQLAALVAAIHQIGRVVLLSHSQGGGLAFHATDQARDLVRGHMMLEPHGMPMTFTPDLPATPACVMVGDFFGEHDYWRHMRVQYDRSLAAWAAAGGRAEFRDLPAEGIRGNSHMLMMDRNSDRIVDLVVGWLDRHHASGAFD